MYKILKKNSKQSYLTFLQQKTDQSNNLFLNDHDDNKSIKKTMNIQTKCSLFVFLTSDVKKNSKLKMRTILWPLYTVRIKLHT